MEVLKGRAQVVWLTLVTLGCGLGFFGVGGAVILVLVAFPVAKAQPFSRQMILLAGSLAIVVALYASGFPAGSTPLRYWLFGGAWLFFLVVEAWLWLRSRRGRVA